ncbi:site-specific DNA-methyltransferase [Chitinophaga pollutisoli]|uniref:site-specific DNA-methyltransferase (adenine-specific) n=1 Tax=Chitinophaga pollutisoli TaxID=3133966 RepID=A0ABZ2YVG7_9BACT
MSNIEKLPLTSMDIKDHQLEKLKELFPEVFTEGNKIDWEKLKLTLGENVDTGKERFGMNWPGKADCFKTIQQPSIATLVPDREESIDFDNTQNLFIEGDNLEVLKLLQKSYLGKIKMIYIDPPYNTGNDFIYPDNYAENLSTYLEYTGQVDSEGKKFSTNTETDGRFHSKWMNMMYPRLFFARNLLQENGLIFISIDNNEVSNLRKICDEVFGEENFVEQVAWKNKYGAGAKTKGFIEVHEYILCYSKSPISNIAAPLNEEQIKAYKNIDDKYNIRGGYITQPLMTTSMGDRKNLQYSITHNGDEIIPEKQWVWEKERLLKAIANDEVVFNKQDNGKYSVRSKQYLKDEKGKVRSGKPISLFNGPFNQEGTSEVKELFGYEAFSFPKPVSLLKYLLSFSINDFDDKGGIVLDFFSGSGSTAQAVYELNMEDGGERKFICVQLPELIEETSQNYQNGLRTIADVCKRRIKKSAKKIKLNISSDNSLFKPDSGKIDLGFKVFKLEQSNFRIWDASIQKNEESIQAALDLHVSHLSSNAQQESILYEILLKSGFDLTTSIEKLEIESKTVFSVASGELLICLEKNLTRDLIKAIAEKQPTRVICLDEGFQNNDQLKTNAVQIMKSKNVVSFRTV